MWACVPLHAQIYSKASRGNTFIFIFFVDIVIRDCRTSQPRLLFLLRCRVSEAAGVWLTLNITLGMRLTSLDKLSLGFHQLVELLGAFARVLCCHSLTCVCSFGSSNSSIGIAIAFVRPLPAIRWGFRAGAALFTKAFSLGGTVLGLLLLVRLNWGLLVDPFGYWGP